MQQFVPSRPRGYQDDDPLRIGPAHVPRPRLDYEYLDFDNWS